MRDMTVCAKLPVHRVTDVARLLQQDFKLQKFIQCGGNFANKSFPQ